MDAIFSNVNTKGEAEKQTSSIIIIWIYSGESDGEVPLMGRPEDQNVLDMVWDNGKDVLKYTSKVKIKEPGKKENELVLSSLEQLESEVRLA